MLFHILRYKFRMFLATTFDFRPVTVIRGLGSILVYGAFAVGAYTFAHSVTAYVMDQTRAGLYLYHQFISMMMFVFFMAVNLGNIIVSYATLYKSSEVNFLLTKPVTYTNVFVLKFLDNFLYSSTTLFLVGFTVLLGYGRYFGYPWYFFVGVLLFVLVPFMFLAACLAVIVLMGIMKTASRIGFRRVMAGLFLLYFLFIFLFFRVTNPIQLVQDVNRYYPNVDQYLSELSPGFLSYLPNHWVSQFLFYVARNDLPRALPYVAILIGTSMAAFVICLLVARRFYFRSWNVALQVQALGSTPYDPDRISFFDFRRGGLLPPQLDSLVKKELFTFLREPSQWIHLLVMVILTFLFVMSASNLDLHLRATEFQLITYLVLFAFGGFLSSSLALRFIFPLISLEGKAYWSIRSAPVEPARIYGLKLLMGFALLLVLSELVAISTNIPFVRFTHHRPVLLWFGIFSAFWISLAVASMNLGLGGYFSNFSEKNPIRLASSQGATLSFLFTLVFLLVLIAIVIVPLTGYFQWLFIFKPFDLRSIVVPGTSIAVVSMVLALAASAVGLQTLGRDF
ncbi:MAG TPA: hypothetical protein VMM57_04110 [Bacteroidota bacterium]|nr:hypothetical protein [Bacteroidota bacterium]